MQENIYDYVYSNYGISLFTEHFVQLVFHEMYFGEPDPEKSVCSANAI